MNTPHYAGTVIHAVGVAIELLVHVETYPLQADSVNPDPEGLFVHDLGSQAEFAAFTTQAVLYDWQASKVKLLPVTLAQSDELAIEIQELEYQKHLPAVDTRQSIDFVYPLQTDLKSMHAVLFELLMQSLLYPPHISSSKLPSPVTFTQSVEAVVI